VGSVGWITDPFTVRFSTNNPDIHIGRHAVSIDEGRCFSRQNLWRKPGPGQNYKQVWFAGVHSDVGGGYPEQQSGLIVNRDDLAEVLGKSAGSSYAPVDASGELHNSMKGAWKILEYLPRRHWNGQLKPTEWILYRKRPRSIAAGSVLHQAVLDRLNDRSTNYNPPNLPKDYNVDPWSVWPVAQPYGNGGPAVFHQSA